MSTATPHHTLRNVIVLSLLANLAMPITYLGFVKRGDWGMRSELTLEVAASGFVPFQNPVFAEQRLPEYRIASDWIAPAFELIHSIDVHFRPEYWRERDWGDFDFAPPFDLSTEPGPEPSPSLFSGAPPRESP